MTINSSDVSRYTDSVGYFDSNGVYQTTLNRGVRISDLQAVTISSEYYTTSRITAPEITHSFPKHLEERFTQLEGLVQVLNSTIQELLLEVHELKKKCQDDNK